MDSFTLIYCNYQSVFGEMQTVLFKSIHYFHCDNHKVLQQLWEIIFPILSNCYQTVQLQLKLVWVTTGNSLVSLLFIGATLQMNPFKIIYDYWSCCGEIPVFTATKIQKTKCRRQTETFKLTWKTIYNVCSVTLSVHPYTLFTHLQYNCAWWLINWCIFHILHLYYLSLLI